MDKIVSDFLERNIPNQKEHIKVDIKGGDNDYYEVTAHDGDVFIEANAFVPAMNGLYDYLKEHCRVQLSWCGNRTIDVKKLIMFDGKMTKKIVQKYRVYMNYCTLNYSMSWWDFTRWEKEIDFMALNGINMPLAVVGSEAVWYKTLLDFGITKADALSTVTGPAFTAWHFMTNIDSYLPPPNEEYIEERIDLGRKILARYLEFGMIPIEQGFSGHMPLILEGKIKPHKLYKKWGWNGYEKTGQLDPLDPIFHEIGMKYLENMDEIFGNHHYIACDPFHEGAPPKKGAKYLSAVGKSINALYEDFDKDSIWVMQGWTPRTEIIKAVPKDRLLILDLPSDRSIKFDNFWGYETVAGMLHNFGGKNAMQGQIRRHCTNAYKRLDEAGVNVVGSGMFMEGIEQNPVVYDLQFKMLTEPNAIDFGKWLSDYVDRRYGSSDPALIKAWDILMDTCYADKGYHENEVGSTVASRPELMPKMTGPCCYTNIWYDTKKLEHALALFISVADKYKDNDGYQYDLTDITRQVLSNRFHDNEVLLNKAYEKKDIDRVKGIAKTQLGIIMDMDKITSHRSEMCLDRWLGMAQHLATNEEEKRYFDRNARTLVTLWADKSVPQPYMLYDYSWREWSGLLSGYYYKRWSMFYDVLIDAMEKGKKLKYPKIEYTWKRSKALKTKIGKALYDFECSFLDDYRECTMPTDSDVIPDAKLMVEKYNIK